MSDSTTTPDSKAGVGDFEPFAQCWIAEDGRATGSRAHEWAVERMGYRGTRLLEFDDREAEEPETTTLPMPHPGDVVVIGVSDAASRRRALARVDLFPCSIAVVPEEHPPGWGVLAGVDRIAGAAMTADAAAIEAEHAGEPLLLVHAVPEARQPFSTRPGHTDPALRVARQSVETYHPAVELSCRLRSSPPAQALLDESRGRSLVVVGGERLGSAASVLDELVERTGIPLLIARAGGNPRLGR